MERKELVSNHRQWWESSMKKSAHGMKWNQWEKRHTFAAFSTSVPWLCVQLSVANSNFSHILSDWCVRWLVLNWFSIILLVVSIDKFLASLLVQLSILIFNKHGLPTVSRLLLAYVCVADSVTWNIFDWLRKRMREKLKFIWTDNSNGI